MGIAANDNDYDDCAYTCDYCDELASKPAAFWDARTQMGVCEYCITVFGIDEIKTWVASLPGHPLPASAPPTPGAVT